MSHAPLLLRSVLAVSFALGVLGRVDQAQAQTCVGDCDGDGRVLVHELLLGVNIVLELRPVSACAVFANDEGIVDIAQLMKGVNNALRECSALPSMTPTATPPPATASATPSLTVPAGSPTATATLSGSPSPIVTATITATATATATSTRTPAVCGDGFVSLDQGETCDDGNTEDGDSCPSNCRIENCAGPAQGTLTVELRVTTTPADLTLGGLTLFLGYPERRVSIPGSDNDAAVQAHVSSPAGFSPTANDLNYALRTVLIDPTLTGISGGTALAVQFEICAGEAVPVARDFQCQVEDATALDEQGTPLPVTEPVSCSVQVRPAELPLVCGDGIVNLAGGETCDDGNTLDGDGCPATCRIEACAGPAQGRLTVRAQFATTPSDLGVAGMTLLLDYPDGRVALPGAGNDPTVQARVASPAGFSVTPNDFDYALRGVLLDPTFAGLHAGTALSVDFDICAGEAVPVARDFHCSVVDAAAFDEQEQLIDVSDQVTCTIVVEPAALPLVCGDGIVNLAGGETCDDGNTADGDGCPSTCHVDPCALPGTQTLTANVVFSTTPPNLALSGMTLLVDYPEGAVGIQGSNNDAAVLSHVAAADFSLTPNDLDYALRAVLIDPTFLGVGAGTALTIEFDMCQGAAPPAASAFSCTVLDAADTDLAPVTGDVSCSVVLP